MALPFKYEVALQLNDGSNHKFSLDEKGWAAKEQLNQTKEISLIPTGNTTLPVVACQVPEGAKPIIKSRVFGSIGAGGENVPGFRVYAIGYKQKRRRPYVIWILPNGTIEMGDEPLYAPLLLQMGFVESN
jgi:hypothetical protein